MDEALLQQWQSPGKQYRGKPFWAWNGELEPDELRRQIRIMKQMGLGGFFMHSRVGLATPYLSDTWFECIRACIDEAKKNDMEAWLYDEDRWPSGAAGGIVTKDSKYRMRHLNVTIVEPGQSVSVKGEILAVDMCHLSGTTVTDLERQSSEPGKELPKNEMHQLVYWVEIHESSDWFNGGAYLDTSDHEAVQEFIRVTHEEYQKRIGENFGECVPGIFTDEPNYGFKWCPRDKPVAHMPWTRNILSKFKERYGYDLKEHLASLFFDIDGQPVNKARYHYHDCMTWLFADAFSRQIGEWCDKNGLEFTGHVLAEETLSSQTNKVGSAMRFYEYMQAPGMDILTQYRREYDTAKQVASAARQFGRKWRLTETYGCTGWDFPFTGHKAVGDWQLALGINLRCQHLSYYTMEGQAKRDYPASIFYHSPWWEHYSVVEDYYARAHVLMSQGKEIRDILVIHPNESMWVQVKYGWNMSEETQKIDRELVELRDTLLRDNLDFDYGDEDILARHTRIEDKDGTAYFIVGEACYRVVVVPQLITIRASTLDLLETFIRKGGTVIWAGKSAPYENAVPSSRPSELAKRCIRTERKGDALAKAAAEKGRRISIADKNGNQIAPTLYLLREDETAYYLFICNAGYDFTTLSEKILPDIGVKERTAEFPEVVIEGCPGCKGSPQEYDLSDGTIYKAVAEYDNTWRITTSLPKLGSRLFVLPKQEQTTHYGFRPVYEDISQQQITDDQWAVSCSEANVCVLDRPVYTIDSSKENDPKDILSIDGDIREYIGIKRRGGQMVQPWAREKGISDKKADVALTYTFAIETVPSGDIFLALEQPRRYGITLNGNAIDTENECGYWVDRSLRTIRIDPVLFREGRNEIVLQTIYNESHPGLEIVYLLGLFGVRVENTALTITQMPTMLTLGDWVPQGLPFYAGSIGYRTKLDIPESTEGERLFLRVPSYEGVAVRVLLDGTQAGFIAWEPNEIDITEYCTSDSVSICIEVLGHRRNSHGPFHLREKYPNWTGPGQFNAEIEEYNLVPCGLMETPELVIRKVI